MQQLLHRNQIPLELITVLAPVILDNSIPEFVPASDPKKVLFVGRITPEKGLRQLIEALAPLEAEWELIVAGDGEERKPCQELASQLSVAHKIQFLGWKTKWEVTSLYRKCGIVVVPSLWPEPFGRVGPEAFVNGRPVVAFAVGGVPDWLEDGTSGYLISPGDVVQLRNRIGMLLESPTQQVQMGNKAREQALIAWKADFHVNSLLQSFSRACARG
jgi:glycosyltransferase involved in cell wall biosynthesis